MSAWKTVASSTTTPVANRTRAPATVGSSPCARAAVAIEALARMPANRARTTVGVGERIKLTYSLGSATWSKSGGTLDNTSGVSVIFDAPDRAATVTVTATGRGCSVTLTFTVIEPTGVLMERASGTNVWHVNAVPSVGIRTSIYLLPDTVSFKFIEVSEDDCAGIVTGYFVGTPLDGVSHGTHGAGTWVTVSDTVAGKGALVMGQDTAQSGSCAFGEPYAGGTFDWPIPWLFRVGAGAQGGFTTVHQRFTIDAAGDMTVSKAGANGAAALGDPNATY